MTPTTGSTASGSTRVASAIGCDPEDASRLYLALGRISRALRREAAGAPMGHGALSAISSLVAHGPMRLGALAEIEGVSAPSMTRIVTSLERLAAVRRTTDPVDGRAFLVQPTARGRRQVEAGRAARMQALRRRLDGLAPGDRKLVSAAVPALEALAAREPGQ